MLNIPSMSGPLGAQVLTHWANDQMKNSRISSTRRHPAIRTSCVGPMGLVLKLGLVKTQGVMYCIYRV